METDAVMGLNVDIPLFSFTALAVMRIILGKPVWLTGHYNPITVLVT